MKKLRKAAILYDFDKTLSVQDMQNDTLIPMLGQEPKEFWKEVGQYTEKHNLDKICSYLFFLMKKFAEKGTPIRRDTFADLGKGIQYFPGVEEWFGRINAYGLQHGLEIEHYIISSGMKELLDSTSIAKEFRKIYACRYHYDEEGKACWPALIVNYTTKTQYIFRVNKQVLEESDEDDLNKYTEKEDRPVPFRRMIYIADGLTDVPCMKLVKEHGGKSIVVYNDSSVESYKTAQKLAEDDRVNYLLKADYREGSEMDAVVKSIINGMEAADQLEELERKYSS
ncbi:MAG: haloacid dehalogenase-like hydrolase [Erysipelotrichaceae bacterium]|nr:haloacid dehalogenase-like hydrolase [Erysipelotrichaceae bacterium]